MQERKNPSSAQDFFAYSIKEKRAKRFSTPDFINQIRAVRRNRERIDKRKTRQAFFASRLTGANPNNENQFLKNILYLNSFYDFLEEITNFFRYFQF